MNMPKIQPCIKCNNTDIEILNCGYSSFNCGHAKCKECGNEMKAGHINSDQSGDIQIIKDWNKLNNVKTAIVGLEKELERIPKRVSSIKKKIRDLKKKLKNRGL